MLCRNIFQLRTNIFNQMTKANVLNYKKRHVLKLLCTKSPYLIQPEKSEVQYDARIHSLLDTLNKLSINNNIITMLNNNHPILNVSSDQLFSNSTTLLEFGFTKDTVGRIIVEYPNLCNIKNDELFRLLDLWRQVNFTENHLLHLLSKHPQFIEFMGKNVLLRISYLLPYLENYKNIAVLLINVPGVIYENWGTLKAKLDYLHTHHIPKSKIVNCNALELSLFEMKTRFKFLERVGVYKQIDSYKKKLAVKNPSITNILCTSDEVFAEKIANVTLEEYEVFCELYKLECKDDEEDCDYEYNSE
ncbi:transcription termination factor 4, mitochondrial [Lycorma delicatula]|uniref:transcription termination factor 4, mitochondrial n=1 Tax=Lycorma delicatula TaxID=130591 RepID=UPI003F512895